MNRSFIVWCITVAAAAFVCFTLPWIPLVIAFSVVGLPITIFIFAAPTLGMLTIAAALGRLALPRKWGWFVGIALGLVVLAVPPLKPNRTLNRKAAELTAGDRDLLIRPVSARTIAVRRQSITHSSSPGATPCDDFCRRALLGRKASQVMIVDVKSALDPLDPHATARSFRIERRQACPTVKVERGGWELTDQSNDWRRRISSAELMQLAVAKGDCLIEESRPLADADMVITAAPVASGTDAYGAGFNLMADTVSAHRITVHQRDGEGVRETFRTTGVTLSPLAPLLIPTQISGYGFSLRPGFVRLHRQRNLPSTFAQAPDWTEFLTRTLGFDLALHPEGLDGDRRSQIEAALGRPEGPDGNTQRLVADFFNSITGKTMSAEDRALAERIVADQRLALPFGSGSAVWSAKGADGDYFRRVAKAGMDRIESIAASLTPGRTTDAPAEQLRLASLLVTASSDYPDDFRPRLEALARNRVTRVAAFRALYALASFGPDAITTFLYLIDDAKAYGTEKFGPKYIESNDWQHPYLAGLTGLCLLGPAGAVALPEIENRLRAGDIRTQGPYGELARHTFRSLGMSTDALSALWQSVDPSFDRKRFDREGLRPLSARSCTSFWS